LTEEIDASKVSVDKIKEWENGENQSTMWKAPT
jgi:hypothetical protein